MARRAQQRRQFVRGKTKASFSLGELVNLGGIPLLTAMLTGIGFYFSTNAKLERYGDEIKTINQRIEVTGKVVSDKTIEDTAQREKIRDAFLNAQTKTNDGISKLDTRLAVAETNQKVANDALKQISDTLQKISTFPSSRR